MKLKKSFIFVLCLSLVLCSFIPVAAFSSDTKNESTDEPSNLNITVVVPNKKEEETKEKQHEPTPTVIPTATEAPIQIFKPPLLYPINIWENEENGRIEIIKTYELTEKDKPENIPRDSFIRNGVQFEFTDIIKHNNSSMEKKEQTETVTLNSDTQNVDAIIELLAPTLEYKSEDGYIGILELDISSIKTEQSGTKKSNYTVNATREYPHLSSNDASLVPQTINDNGRTLTLTDVNWKTENTEAVDYNQLPVSYRAIATYSATASKTVVTGYTTTAVYKGGISKTVTGNDIYTAHFIGTIPEPEPEYILESPYPEKSFIIEQSYEDFKTGESISLNNNEPDKTIETKNSSNALLYIVLIIALFSIGLNGFICFWLLKNNNNKYIKEDNI